MMVVMVDKNSSLEEIQQYMQQDQQFLLWTQQLIDEGYDAVAKEDIDTCGELMFALRRDDMNDRDRLFQLIYLVGYYEENLVYCQALIADKVQEAYAQANLLPVIQEKHSPAPEEETLRQSRS